MSKLTTLLFFLFVVQFGLGAQIKADFIASGNTGCSPLKVEFTDQSQNATKWYWDLGNGNISTKQNPSAIYNTPGKYTVMLIATDASGKNDTFKRTDFVIAYKIPFAKLSASKTEICAKEQVNFLDVSTPGDGVINSWTWDFGDGGTALAEKPTATYLTPGVYDVTLSIKDNYGCKSEAKSTQLITVNELPEAEINSNLRNSCRVPKTIQFSNPKNNADVTLTQWNFGDGKNSNEVNPSHNYASFGSFTVTLEVTNKKGCKNKLSESNFISILKPTPDFSVSEDTVCLDAKVKFINNSKPFNDSVKWFWEFGDGATSIEKAPSHAYSKAGSYHVKLSMEYGDGCAKDITKNNVIYVLPLPSGTLPDDTIICYKKGLKVKFRLANPANLTDLDWYVNGKLGYKSKPDNEVTMSVDPATSYKIKVLGYNKLGCKYSIDSFNIYIDQPFPDVQFEDKKGCVNRNVKASNIGTSKYPVVSYDWDGPGFSDKNTPSINFNIDKVGKFPVILTVTDAYGCKGTDTNWVYAGKKIEPFFEAEYKEICSGEVVKIVNKTPLSPEDSVIFEYLWNTDSKYLYTDKDTVYFQLSGSGIVTLRVTTNFFECKYPKDFPEIKFKLLGPKANGKIAVDCEKDSLIAINLSEHYTSFSWNYVTHNGKHVTAYENVLRLKLSEIKSLVINATHSGENCHASHAFDLASDPNSAHFSLNMDCKTRNVEVESAYEEKVDDTSFHWKLKHLPTGKITTYNNKKMVFKNLEEGAYKLELQVNNKKYVCPKKWSKNFSYYNWPVNVPKIELSNSQCYPVDLKLTDNSYGKGMVESYWDLNKGEKKIPVTQALSQLTFKGVAKDLTISLYRKDSFGCSKKVDTLIAFSKKSATIARKQKDESCERAVITLFPSMGGIPSPETDYQYFWDFGYRTSTQKSDTIIVSTPRETLIKLTVKDKNGCEYTDQLSEKLGATKPRAKFSNSEATAACPPLKVTFEDESEPGTNASITKWEWDFGDGTKSEKQDPFKMYIYPGTYSVQLTITNNRGCSDVYKIPDLVVLKGPTGTYFFNKKESCAPLDVRFWTTSSPNTKIFEFDLADGEVVDKAARNHTYNRPGMYVPRLILTDSTGCRFTLPPKDTLYVYPNPEVKFEAMRVCADRDYMVGHQSNLFGDSMKKVSWTMNNQVVSEKDSAQLKFKGKTKTNVDLRIETIHGCSNTYTGTFSSFGMDLKLDTDKPKYCLGESIIITDQSKKDTALRSKNVWINGLEIPYQQSFTINATEKGKFGAMLVYEDVIGCIDTWINDGLLKIGDTIPPPPLKMYRSTVIDDFSTETRFAESKEVDFDSYKVHYFKDGNWHMAQSFTERKDTNVTIHQLNTLDNSYCHKISQTNYCGLSSDLIQVKDQCTIETKATGDTNCVRVKWTPYGGWNKIKEYNIWRKQSDETSYTKIGTVAGAVNNYLDSAIKCHIVYDYKIEGIEEEGNLQNSFSDTARAKPLHFVPVPAPEVWRATVENNEYARVEWIMPTAPKYPVEYFSLWKQDHTGWQLIAPSVSASSFDLNDYKTQVQASNYSYRVTATDICQTLSPQSNVGRTILLNVTEDKKEGFPRLNWSSYIYWNEGVEKYRIERSVLKQPFVEIGTVNGSDTEFVDKQVPLHCVKDIEYRVIGVRNQPAAYPDSSFNCISVSNHRQFVPELRFFIPNAFTPDANTLNESFAPRGIYYFSYTMKLYNRWGEKVYEGNTCNNSWNGVYNSIPAMSGVYAYAIEAVDYSGKVYKFSGTVHLLR